MAKDDNIKQLICRTEGCGCSFCFELPEAPGIYEVKCPNGHPNRIRIKGPADGSVPVTGPGLPAVEDGEDSGTETTTISRTAARVRGKLVVIPAGILGRFRSRVYPLHPGPNVIGRHDKACPSDIEIGNDKFVSRRSVNIDVSEKEQGFLFKMTVLKAANPVLLNGKRLHEGEVIYLNYGDTLQLGSTRVNLIKE